MTASRDSNDTMIDSEDKPVAPNAALSSSVPANRYKRGRHCQSSGDKQQLSASIPLPKSHIHRTPSELQLADDIRRAEYEDVRMYARLVVGMQSQCMVSGYVHPLTKKSLQDILKTKQANQDELENKLSLHDHAEEDDDWELSYADEDDRRGGDENSVDTPQPVHPMGAADKAPTVVKTPSNGSIVSNLSNTPPLEGAQEDEEPEDECVFSLEL